MVAWIQIGNVFRVFMTSNSVQIHGINILSLINTVQASDIQVLSYSQFYYGNG